MAVLSLESVAIMVVAPSKVLGVAVQRELNALGAQHITRCQSQIEALTQLTQQAVDLIICSLYFEDGDAIELKQTLQNNSEWRNTQMILISSEERSELLEKAKLSGMVAVLPRSFTSAALAQAVQQGLNQ